ncbi:MAG: extracellular solute-binding protein [Anaerolineales bacterium]|nr:extracellular solute-binding protein [Anaerolineales bacterium]
MQKGKSKSSLAAGLPIGLSVCLVSTVVIVFAVHRGGVPLPGRESRSPSAEAAASPPDAAASSLPTVGPTRAGPVTIRWWHTDDVTNTREVWRKLADEYTAAHPNVTIEITTPEGGGSHKTAVDNAMRAGDPPDIFLSWGGSELTAYAKAGFLLDITGYLDADGGAWRETFGPGALGVFSFAGRNYGAPWEMGMAGIWYNKTLFARAGITAPPATWAEFLHAVDALAAAGITPIAVGAGDRWPAALWWEYLATRLGGQAAFEAACSRTGSFADPPFLEAGELLRDLVTRSPFQEGFLDTAYEDVAALIGDGRAAMELMGEWSPTAYNFASADKQGLGDALGWFPFPAVEGGRGDPDDVLGGGKGFMVGRNAPPEAVDFLKYLTRAESLARYAAAAFGSSLPPVRGGAAGLTYPLMVVIQQAVWKAGYVQLYYDSALPRTMESAINDGVWGIFAGTLSPEQAARGIEDAAEADLG